MRRSYKPWHGPTALWAGHLTCQIQLVQENPVAGLQGSQKGPIRPGKLSRQAALHGQVRTQQVHHVCLLAQVDAYMPVACNASHMNINCPDAKTSAAPTQKSKTHVWMW
jgi:hypothetical protein